MTKELKPTNKEIAMYIMEWLHHFDENGIILVEDVEWFMDVLLNDTGDFMTLRKMFGQEVG